ncbi:hypothetical protein [Haloterrigena salifodinae]|uniref:hypothetical protein n=1 Tax=Haloterrigena salifodinae TaxID=2675099 RepID=UPI002012DC8B|nr:hypothetical protein [Haloterrigena salifodinae]
MQRRSYMASFAGFLGVGLAEGTPLTDRSTTSTDPQDESERLDDPPIPDRSTTPSSRALRNGSFESYLDGWTVGTDLPSVPGESTDPVAHSVSITSERASDGDHSLALYIDGTADDGTIWVEQPVNVSRVRTVTVDVYSQQESFNRMSQVAFFAGKKPRSGLEESDFDREKDIEDHSGWKTYSYSVDDLSGTVTLAVGMNVVWETGVRRYFDDVRLVTE